MTYNAASLDVTVLLKEELMISFTFWKLPPDPFPVLSQISTFLIRHYLWNLMHGLKHNQELGDMCQQDVISPSFRAAAVNSDLPACLPDYKWKDRPSRKHQAFSVFKRIRSFISSPTEHFSSLIYSWTKLQWVTAMYQTPLSKIISDLVELRG